MSQTLIRTRQPGSVSIHCGECNELIYQWEEYISEKGCQFHVHCAPKGIIKSCPECFMVEGCDCGKE